MKRQCSLVVTAGLLSIFCVSASGQSLDWTPLLVSWEDGCTQSDEWAEFRKNIVSYDNDTLLPDVGNITLPAQYKDALGEISLLKRDEEYSLFEVNVKYGNYYNIPVNNVGFFIGHSNGIMTSYVELDASYENASAQLSEVDYSLVRHDSGTYQAKINEDTSTGNAVLFCDNSV